MAMAIKRPSRTFSIMMGPFVLIIICYTIWSPGMRVQDGRHNPGKNGIWLQHGWLGDDAWFERNARDKSLFRDEEKIKDLAGKLKSHHIRYVYPHLCPCTVDGSIAKWDQQQTARFLKHFSEFKVIPWVGGVLDKQCHPSSKQWRDTFVSSVIELLETHPDLAGIQINIEPMPSGNADFLKLLSELKSALPKDQILSVAAYPPPTRWHPHEEVHWDETYFRAVAKQVDQMVPMMYDTAIRQQKVYQHLMVKWTREVIQWSGDTEVLLGVPAYDDSGVGYHDPKVENIQNAIWGIHAGITKSKSQPQKLTMHNLSGRQTVPANFSGLAIYSEWEMSEDEWKFFEREFAP